MVIKVNHKPHYRLIVHSHALGDLTIQHYYIGTGYINQLPQFAYYTIDETINDRDRQDEIVSHGYNAKVDLLSITYEDNMSIEYNLVNSSYRQKATNMVNV